jgi:hypothetical protein
LEFDALNRHQTGFVAELKAATYYAEQDYEIYWPNLTQSSIDFIALKGREIRRVQVKSAYWIHRKTGASYLQATIRKGCDSNQSYSKEDCDDICIVGEGRIWIIPVEKVPSLQTVIVEKGQQTRRGDPRNFDPSPYLVVDKLAKM